MEKKGKEKKGKERKGKEIRKKGKGTERGRDICGMEETTRLGQARLHADESDLKEEERKRKERK